MIDDLFLDHLADRHRLASPALDVAGAKPVEAVLRIVRALLLRQKEHEAVAIGERRPAGAKIVARRRLRTAVQDDHQLRLRVRRRVFEHAQRARIGAESCHLGQMVERGVEIARWKLSSRSSNIGRQARDGAPSCVITRRTSRLLDNDAHAMTTVIIGEVARDPHARVLHLDDC